MSMKLNKVAPLPGRNDDMDVLKLVCGTHPAMPPTVPLAPVRFYCTWISTDMRRWSQSFGTREAAETFGLALAAPAYRVVAEAELTRDELKEIGRK